jgi:hypothetical protein
MNVVVLVEIAMAANASAPAAALMETCRAGMTGRGTCVVSEARRQPSANDTYAVAVVLWDSPAHNEARVEVGFREIGRTNWRNRSVVFLPQDPDLERWRTVGFAIATLVGEGLEATVPQPGVVPEVKPKGNEKVEVPVEQERPVPDRLEGRRVWIDAVASAARGAASSPPAVGARLDGSLHVRGNWILQIGAAYAVQKSGTDDLTVRWMCGSAGVAFRFGVAPRIGIEGRLQAHLERVQATATDPITAASGSAGAWLGGGRTGVAGSWMFFDRMGAVVGADATFTPGTTKVLARSRPLATVSALDVAAYAGLRFELY